MCQGEGRHSTEGEAGVSQQCLAKSSPIADSEIRAASPPSAFAGNVSSSPIRSITAASQKQWRGDSVAYV